MHLLIKMTALKYVMDQLENLRQYLLMYPMDGSLVRDPCVMDGYVYTNPVGIQYLIEIKRGAQRWNIQTKQGVTSKKICITPRHCIPTRTPTFIRTLVDSLTREFKGNPLRVDKNGVLERFETVVVEHLVR